MAQSLNQEKFRNNDWLFDGPKDGFKKDSSDEEPWYSTNYSLKQDEDKVPKKSFWKKLEFELIMNNGVMQKYEKYYHSKLMSFDHHPR